MIATLIEIYLNETHYFADKDVYIDDVKYQKKLLKNPSLNEDIVKGSMDSVTLNLSNFDGYFNNLYANEEFRRKKVKIIRIDGDNAYAIAGYITQCNMLNNVSMSISFRHEDLLQTILPQKVLEQSDWTHTPPQQIIPEVDRGKPYPLAFGNAIRVPCIYMQADYDNDWYDYILSVGQIKACGSIYRDDVLVDSSEYTVYDGTQASPYHGYSFIRFIVEQVDFNGRPYKLSSDLQGMTFGKGYLVRNPITIIKEILTNTDWGLGLSVNDDSFKYAAREIHEMGLFCDGSVYKERKALDIIKEFLFLSRAILDMNSDGEFIITVNEIKEDIALKIGSGDGILGNIVKLNSRKRKNSTSAIKQIQLEYNYDPSTREYKDRNSKSVFADFGVIKSYRNRFLSDGNVSSVITSYMQRFTYYTDEVLSVKIGKDGTSLQKYDLVQVDIPNISIRAIYMVHSIKKGITDVSLTLSSYSPFIYDKVCYPFRVGSSRVTDNILSCKPNYKTYFDNLFNWLKYDVDIDITKHSGGEIWNITINGYADPFRVGSSRVTDNILSWTRQMSIENLFKYPPPHIQTNIFYR